jgi:hypothetical protein
MTPTTPNLGKTRWQKHAASGTDQETMSSKSHYHLLLSLFVFFSLCSCSVSALIPQSFRHTNLLRSIDLTKPYIRESTTVIIENISNTTQTEYFWGLPLSVVVKLSYLEVKEKKGCGMPNFPIEKALYQHPYLPHKFEDWRI